jgi:hypothetical protein
MSDLKWNASSIEDRVIFMKKQAKEFDNVWAEFGSEIWITYTSGLGGPLQNIKTRRLTLQAS